MWDETGSETTIVDTPELREKRRAQYRLYIGIAIALVGTILGGYLLPNSMRAYSPWMLLGSCVMLAIYGAYLFVADSRRLPVLLQGYLIALTVVLIAPLISGAILSNTSRIMFVLPLVAVFIAIVRTHLIGVIPDVVVGRQDFNS